MIIWITILIIFIYYLIGFLLPATTTIGRALKMSKSPINIFNTINDFRNWYQWAIWNEDNSMEIILSKQTKGVGARYRWKSKIKEIKGGMLVLKNLEVPNLLEYDLFYGKSKRGTLFINIDPLHDSTFVSCAITIENKKKIFARYLFLIIKKSIQKNIDEVLLKIDEVTVEAPIP